MNRIPTAILGATGTVGQRFIQLLENHPWFEVAEVAASDRSAGQSYAQACRWLLPTFMPEGVKDLVVQGISPEGETNLHSPLVFSALPGEAAWKVEQRLASAGHQVCSNASAHRMESDVPLLIPEVNPGHTQLVYTQQQHRDWQGFIVTSANCTTTQLALALKPLDDAFGLESLFITTLQAVSGAGYPGVPSLDILGNVVPYIPGEEEKVEAETCKLLGVVEHDPIVSPETSRLIPAQIKISAQCNRVPVLEGHVECISAGFRDHPTPEAIIQTLESFRAPPEIAKLPSSPQQPMIVLREPDRPQPMRDRETGGGMNVVVGRVRECPLLDVRFVLLGHNTVRGAAGGAIHNAELLKVQGF
jgi:aspartate-semialdehyde dehydrogenase